MCAVGYGDHHPWSGAPSGWTGGGLDMHPVTTWLALVGSVWALFALAEEHLMPVQREQITRWLHGQTSQWAGTCVMVCDSVFGPPGLSGTYCLRVGVASYIVA